MCLHSFFIRLSLNATATFSLKRKASRKKRLAFQVIEKIKRCVICHYLYYEIFALESFLKISITLSQVCVRVGCLIAANGFGSGNGFGSSCNIESAGCQGSAGG